MARHGKRRRGGVGRASICEKDGGVKVGGTPALAYGDGVFLDAGDDGRDGEVRCGGEV